MTRITYREHDGTEHPVDVDDELSLMEGSTLNMVPGIEGMCGGICSCATCHVYVPAEWQSRLGEPSPGELKILETVKYRQPNSRLGCQIAVTSALEGLVVDLPPEQGQRDAI